MAALSVSMDEDGGEESTRFDEEQHTTGTSIRGDDDTMSQSLPPLEPPQSLLKAQAQAHAQAHAHAQAQAHALPKHRFHDSFDNIPFDETSECGSVKSSEVTATTPTTTRTRSGPTAVIVTPHQTPEQGKRGYYNRYHDNDNDNDHPHDYSFEDDVTLSSDNPVVTMGGERERHNPLAHSHTHSHTHGHMSSPSLWVSIRGKRLGLVTPSHSEAFSSSPPSTLKEEVEDVDDELDESEESAENDESHDESEEESQSQSQTHNERGSNSNERREESLTQELSEFVANPASTKGKMSTTEQTNRHTRSQIIDGFQDEVMLNNFVQEERKKNMF